MSRNVGVLRHVLLPLFVQKDVLQMCHKSVRMIQLWRNHLKPRKEDDDWEFGILEAGSSLERFSFWNYQNFFNAELLSGNGSFRKSAILDLVPSLNLLYWWRGATYIICTPCNDTWSFGFTARIILEISLKYLPSEEDLEMYLWIFYVDLQLNSESHQTQNKEGKREVTNLISIHMGVDFIKKIGIYLHCFNEHFTCFLFSWYDCGVGVFAIYP